MSLNVFERLNFGYFLSAVAFIGFSISKLPVKYIQQYFCLSFNFSLNDLFEQRWFNKQKICTPELERKADSLIKSNMVIDTLVLFPLPVESDKV